MTVWGASRKCREGDGSRTRKRQRYIGSYKMTQYVVRFDSEKRE